MKSSICVCSALLGTICMASDSNPGMPAPYFSWDTLPIAFHGANKARAYTEAEVEQLARYQMVTLEKWYTPCGAQGPDQAGPECNVEAKMYEVFRGIKAKSPNVTTILYLNSMFNFAFYDLNGKMLEREAAGKPALLRDKNGTLVTLCNDGNVYCNITNFDWSEPEVAELWLEALLNATRHGGVDGVFADHGFEGSHMPSSHDLKPADDPTLCNGKGSKRKCYKFTPEFAVKFNAGHDLLLNHTQDVLSNLTGGPVIDGPYADWHVDACDFASLRANVTAGKEGRGARVIEANKGDACNPSESCLAAFLCAADRYTYLACFHSQSTADSSRVVLPHFLPEYSKPLGEPMSDAVEGPSGVWTRKFKNAVGYTMATYDENTQTGQVQWAGDPPSYTILL